MCRILMVFFSCGLEYVFVCLFIFIVSHESFFPRISPIIYLAPYSVRVSLHICKHTDKRTNKLEKETEGNLYKYKHTHIALFLLLWLLHFTATRAKIAEFIYLSNYLVRRQHRVSMQIRDSISSLRLVDWEMASDCNGLNTSIHHHFHNR